MEESYEIQKYIPLSEATYYIMLTLIEPMHGYALMQKVKEMSGELVEIGPGTLYGAFSTLEKEGLISMVSQEHRRKSYILTDKGKQVLAAQIRRIQIMAELGEKLLSRLEDYEHRSRNDANNTQS